MDLILDKFKIGSRDSIIPSGRYHNRRDYMKFPSLGRKDLLYDKMVPLAIKDFSLDHSVLAQIAQRDYLQYSPYHSFAYIIKFLREAALDPKVKKKMWKIKYVEKKTRIFQRHFCFKKCCLF